MSITLLELADRLRPGGGLVLRIDGQAVALHPSSARPLGLLGVRFGSCVDAVAITLASDDGPILAVDRCGEAMLVEAAGPLHSGGAVEGSLLLDVLRRSLGLATAPPDDDVADLVDAVWLERLLRCALDAPLGEPPGWITLARLHPTADPGPPPSPELLRHRRDLAPSWRALRNEVIDGRATWPPISSAMAGWFDDGSFARHAFAVLPDPETMLADLHDLLRQRDVARLREALSQRNPRAH